MWPPASNKNFHVPFFPFGFPRLTLEFSAGLLCQWALDKPEKLLNLPLWSERLREANPPNTQPTTWMSCSCLHLLLGTYSCQKRNSGCFCYPNLAFLLQYPLTMETSTKRAMRAFSQNFWLQTTNSASMLHLTLRENSCHPSSKILRQMVSGSTYAPYARGT